MWVGAILIANKGPPSCDSGQCLEQVEGQAWYSNRRGSKELW